MSSDDRVRWVVWGLRGGSLLFGLVILFFTFWHWNQDVITANAVEGSLGKDIDTTLLERNVPREEKASIDSVFSVDDMFWIWIAEAEEEQDRRRIWIAYQRMWQSVEFYDQGHLSDSVKSLCRAKSYLASVEDEQQVIREIDLAQETMDDLSRQMSINCL